MKSKNKNKKYLITITEDGSNFNPSISYPEPIIEVDMGNILNAHYYYDLSGEVCVDVGGEPVFFSDSGKMHHQIDDLRKEIVKKEKELAQHIKGMKLALVAMEAGLKAAKKAIKKNKKNTPKPEKNVKQKYHRDDCYCKSCYAGSYR